MMNFAFKFDDFFSKYIVYLVHKIGKWVSFDTIKVSRFYLIFNIFFCSLVDLYFTFGHPFSIIFDVIVNTWVSYSDIKFMSSIDEYNEKTIMKIIENRLSSAVTVIAVIIFGLPFCTVLTLMTSSHPGIDIMVSATITTMLFTNIWVAYVIASQPPQKRRKKFSLDFGFNFSHGEA